MAAMTSTFDRLKAADRPGSRFRGVVGWFQLIAFAEAVSWVGLLVGMYFKYLGTPRTEIGVKIFGPAHGAVFVAFVVAAVLVGIAFKWSASTWSLALLGSVVPLGSVIFLMWAERTGRLGARGAVVAAPAAAETT
jgi:integral membrane protein